MKVLLRLLAVAILVSCASQLSQGLLYYHQLREKALEKGYGVSYDNRSFIIDGQRTLLLSGSVHYPRVMVGEWSNIFRQMYLDGLNTVQTYIYWNIHEPMKGQVYDFSGNKNWTLFVEKAAEAGLFVNLRIGPFVASEWDYGGIPYWVSQIPGMFVRSNNGPWKEQMKRFFTDIVEIARPYLASNGGPIILGQVENEFHWDDSEYVAWCGELVEQVNPGIPFLMCNGYSADNTVNTCNGNDCAGYAETHDKDYPGQPLAWTENEGWFQEWDKEPFLPKDNRSAADMAFVVMRWFARGGSHHNYYMWYGGNNFGRKAGSCVTTEYAAGVNLYSDGLPHEPKKTHLQRLHLLLGAYGNVLLNSPSQVDNRQKVLVLNITTGEFVEATEQFAYVYKSMDSAVAFVENDANTAAVVKFNGLDYILRGESSSLVDMNNGKELYNSAKIDTTGIATQRNYSTLAKDFSWTVWQENFLKLEGAFMREYPLEQLNVTQDFSDYLFYQTNITGMTNRTVNLTVESRIANSLLVFINDTFQSAAGFCQHNEGSHNLTLLVNITAGKNHTLTILSVSLGINTHTEPGEYDLKGIVGSVWLENENITKRRWLHRPMLEGERRQVYTPSGSEKVPWSGDWQNYTGMSLVWYRFTFDAPQIKPGASLLLDLNGMERGYIYLNGENLGRYWLVQVSDVYVQRYYTVPQSLLMEKDNLLILGEEIGAQYPENVQLVESFLVVP